MLKNIFALVGVFVVVRAGYRLFDQHVRVALERTITDALTDERREV